MSLQDIRERMTPSRKAVIREWVESIVIAFVLAMFIRTFFFQAFRIPSGSMRMTLIEGDRLIVNKLVYGARVPFTHYRLPGLREPEIGDVLVFIYPVERDRDFIKRLIAKGGQTVEIRFGDVYVDGQKIEHPSIKSFYYYNHGHNTPPGETFVVPQGEYFVLGDNSASSHDSRYWGTVPAEDVVGKAELIYWPVNRLRFIK